MESTPLFSVLNGDLSLDGYGIQGLLSRNRICDLLFIVLNVESFWN